MKQTRKAKTTISAAKKPWKRLRARLVAQGLGMLSDSSFEIPEKLFPTVSIGFPRPSRVNDGMHIELLIEELGIIVSIEAEPDEVSITFLEDEDVPAGPAERKGERR